MKALRQKENDVNAKYLHSGGLSHGLFKVCASRDKICIRGKCNWIYCQRQPIGEEVAQAAATHMQRY